MARRTEIAARGRVGDAVGWVNDWKQRFGAAGAKRMCERATAMECATAMLEYSARRVRLTRNRREARTNGFEEGKVQSAVLLPGQAT